MMHTSIGSWTVFVSPRGGGRGEGGQCGGHPHHDTGRGLHPHTGRMRHFLQLMLDDQ